MTEQPKLRLIAHLDVAAASGIAQLASSLYVIADDQLELAVYDLAGVRTQSIALLSGHLPEEHAARKAKKPDFEALVALPDGSLLALGSGSTQQRQRGVIVQPTAAEPELRVVPLSDLYDALASDLPELNIEGGAVYGGSMYLCSRGNGARRDNVLVLLDLERSLEALQSGRGLTADCMLGLRRVELGELDGTPLSLTDLAVHEGCLLFSAAAEASANTYDDGACAGSVIGRLSAEGLVNEIVATLPAGVKIEGICSAGPHEIYAVADADDPTARAPLFALSIAPWPPAGKDKDKDKDKNKDTDSAARRVEPC